MLKLNNPILIFIALWLSVIWLYSKRYSLILLPLNNSTLIYLSLVLVSFGLSYFLIRILYVDKKFIRKKIEIPRLPQTKKKIKIIFKIWCILTLVEIIYFRGLPLFALLGIGPSGAYTEWGIPSLHGLLNALIICISNYMFFFFIVTKNKKYLYLFLCCIIWPILLITRQMLLTMIVEAAIIYILLIPIKFYNTLRLSLTSLIAILLFGWIGDLRSNAENFIALVKPSEDYADWLPSGVLWVYVYMVSPLNNLNFNIDNFSNFNFDIGHLIAPLFPSVIRKDLFGTIQGADFILVNDNLNVSTIFPVYLNSFGYFGSLFFFFVLGLFLSFIYLKYKSNTSNVLYMFFLVVFIHNIIFSVFVDFFFNLVFLFQFFVHRFIYSPSKFIK